MKTLLLVVLLVVSRLLTAQDVIQITRADSNRVYTSMKAVLASEKPIFRLDLTRSRLKKIPPEVFELTELRELILDRNKIKEVPADITKLKNLEKLSISKNRLKDFAPAICNLRKLRYLDLSDNEIARLPDEIHRLEYLEELILWSNMIGYYPTSLIKMKRLKFVDLLNNEMNGYEQERILSLLPDTEILMSPPCNCIFDDDIEEED